MNKKLIILAVIFSAITIIAAIYIFSSSKNEKVINSNIDNQNEIVFNKQGALNFIKSSDNQLIKTIDIEIAKDDYSREKGLMYRRSMQENQGMLFIFEDNSIRNFWMKNTYISLDIIYVGSDNKIVSIQKSTVPLSEESLPSTSEAKYVVEVIAGFTDKYNIKAGDIVSF